MSISKEFNIIDIINNVDNHYNGDLRHYFAKVLQSNNRHAPYYNVHHTCTVTKNIYMACIYYSINPQEARTLLIAGLYHDMGHIGKMSNDDDGNIERANIQLRNDILNEDRNFLHEIENLIAVTRFPFKKNNLRLYEQIMRDSDMAQLFEPDWIQQVIIGLSTEFNTDVVSFLKQQLIFIPHIKWHSDWAKNNLEPLIPAKF